MGTGSMSERSGDPLSFFANYRWYLRALNSKRAEKEKMQADAVNGLINRDILDPDWRLRYDCDIKHYKRRLREIEGVIDSIPETDRLLPCKIFLRLHFVMGMSLTEVSEKMNVSLSTVRRIRSRTEDYFDGISMG